MTLEHHRDLAHEFPELKQRIHDLKVESREFRDLYDEYQTLDNEIHRIEQDIETPSDRYAESLKWRRAHLKDRLYGLLTGRLHTTPGTEEFVIRGKFRQPVDHGEVSRDWHERGYSCVALTPPDADARGSSCYARDALLAVVDGSLDVRMHGVDYVLHPGDELFIPRGAPFALRDTGAGPAECLLGFD